MTTSKRRMLTAGLLGGMTFLASSFALQGSLLTDLMNHYQLTESLGGIPSSAVSIGGFIALFLALLLNGKVSKLTLLKLSIGTCALFFFLLPVSSEFALFVLFWGIIGIGLGYLDTLLSACIADWYKGGETKRMMCILHLTYGLAYTLAPIIYTFLLSWLEKRNSLWNRVYYFTALLGLILVVYLFFTAKGVTEQKVVSNAGKGSVFSVKMMSELFQIQNGFCLKLMLAMLCHGVFYGGMNTWINRYVGLTLNSELGDIALTFMFFGVMLSRLIMSFAKLSPETYIRYAGILAGVVMLAAVFCGHPVVMCVAICAGGVLFGAMIPCVLTVGTSVISGDSLLLTTLMLLSMYFGQAVGAPMVGILENMLNLHVGIGVCIVFIALSSMFCLCTRKKQ